MANCLVVLDGVVYVDGVRQDWALPEPTPRPDLTDEEIQRRLDAIYATPTGESGS